MYFVSHLTTQVEINQIFALIFWKIEDNKKSF